MVRGGSRRDDAAPGISSTNVFAALETLKKKKKSSSKDQKGSSKSKGSSKAEEPSQVFWVPAPLNKSWADVDDDDDDYYKSAPVLPGWGSGETQQKEDSGPPVEEDNVFVTVVASIQYRALANKAADAFYKLSNTREQIQSYVFDVIRASVPKLNLDDVFEQKNDIAKAVEDELEKAMSMYGYEIVQTLIVDIEPDEHVKRAMNEINAAARMRMAANEKAEAEKILQIKRAEGEAESKYLAGLGIARQRQAIVDGLRDSVLAFSSNVPGTSAKDVMDMVLITQYFDTMKEIGASSKSSAIFVPHGPGAVKDIAAQVRDGLLQGNAFQ